jgi:hypothetical protein
MTTRWSFEALAIEQVKNNKYERNFFRYDMGISQADWNSNLLIKALKADLNQSYNYKDDPDYREVVTGNLTRLNYHIGELSREAGFGNPALLNLANFDSVRVKETDKYLDSLERKFRQTRKKLVILKDSVASAIKTKIGDKELIQLKENYQNKRLMNTLLEGSGIQQYVKTDKKIIQKNDPLYMIPSSKLGRAHFYAPLKQIGNLQIDTYWFNLLVLWFVILILYLALYYNLLQKLINFFGKPIKRDSTKKEIHLSHSSTD